MSERRTREKTYLKTTELYEHPGAPSNPLCDGSVVAPTMVGTQDLWRTCLYGRHLRRQGRKARGKNDRAQHIRRQCGYIAVCVPQRVEAMLQIRASIGQRHASSWSCWSLRSDCWQLSAVVCARGCSAVGSEYVADECVGKPMSKAAGVAYEGRDPAKTACAHHPLDAHRPGQRSSSVLISDTAPEPFAQRRPASRSKWPSSSCEDASSRSSRDARAAQHCRQAPGPTALGATRPRPRARRAPGVATASGRSEQASAQLTKALGKPSHSCGPVCPQRHAGCSRARSE